MAAGYTVDEGNDGNGTREPVRSVAHTETAARTRNTPAQPTEATKAFDKKVVPTDATPKAL